MSPDPPLSVESSIWVPFGLIKNMSRSASNVWFILRHTEAMLLDETVAGDIPDTAIEEVTPVVLLSGIARFGVALKDTVEVGGAGLATRLTPCPGQARAVDGVTITDGLGLTETVTVANPVQALVVPKTV